MLGKLPTLYSDDHGFEETILESDGTDLYVNIRGATFEWNCDSFEAVKGTEPNLLRQFCLENNELRSCRFEFQFPINIQNGSRLDEAVLHWHLHVGTPGRQNGGQRDMLYVTLDFNNEIFRADSKDGEAEFALRRLQETLPDSVYMKICFNCQCADYNPAGSCPFGSMECFRNRKETYLNVKSKRDYFEICKFADRVQETFVCNEFEKRIPGTGYRG